MTDTERLDAIRAMIKEELSSIKADIDNHKQTHDELEALIEKRFKEMKEMFPEVSDDLDTLKEYLQARKELGSAFLDWGMIMNEVFII